MERSLMLSHSLSIMDTLSGQKLSREIRELVDVMIQMNLTNTLKTIHPNTKEYAFFPTPHGAISKTDHILGAQNKYQQM